MAPRSVVLSFSGIILTRIGTKDVYFEDDFWADDDIDCHGEYRDFEDDSDMAEGFRWTCCNRAGDNIGCKGTKHKAKVNMIVKKAPAIIPKAGRKRKAVDDIPSAAKPKARKGRSRA
jgi:hypothetical protein